MKWCRGWWHPRKIRKLRWRDLAKPGKCKPEQSGDVWHAPCSRVLDREMTAKLWSATNKVRSFSPNKWPRTRSCSAENVTSFPLPTVLPIKGYGTATALTGRGPPPNKSTAPLASSTYKRLPEKASELDNGHPPVGVRPAVLQVALRWGKNTGAPSNRKVGWCWGQHLQLTPPFS